MAVVVVVVRPVGLCELVKGSDTVTPADNATDHDWYYTYSYFIGYTHVVWISLCCALLEWDRLD